VSLSQDTTLARRHPIALTDRWINWRNRCLASARFQALAARLPFTRGLARRRARALFDLCAGFVYSQILFACVRLGLFDALARGAKPLGALANELGLDYAAAERLVRAAGSLQLVSLLPGEWVALGELGAALMGNPGIIAMIEHHQLLYADLRDPVALLRGEDANTALARYWPYAGSSEPAGLEGDSTAPYSALMTASAALVIDDVLAAYPFQRHQRLIDIGGGEGAFSCALAAHAPKLTIALVDLPAVAERARQRFANKGFTGRVSAHGADFLRDPLPQGADIACLLRVLHDHDDVTALKLLRNVRRALPVNATLVIAEPMRRAPGAAAVGDAYFGFYLLAMGRGQARAPDEIANLLRLAGFDAVRSLPTRRPILVGVMAARAV
jgi:demethylspheroidene O-methyltransferase